MKYIVSTYGIIAKVIVVLVATIAIGLVLFLRHGAVPIVESHRSRASNTDPATSCGPVSLAVVSHYLGKPATIAELHAETGAGRLGHCSISDLLRALEHRGFSASAIRYPASRPPKHNLPMILHVDGDHFVVAIGRLADDDVVVVDPPLTPRIMHWSDLASRWRGDAVVVAGSEAELRVALGHVHRP